MSATPYLVMVPTQDTFPARTLVNGIEGMLIVAGSTADAKALAKAQFDQDQDALWDNATVTALVADTDLHNWLLDIVINNANGTLKGHITVLADGTDAAVAATQVLTNDGTNVTAGDTFTIGLRVYTYSASPSVDGDVKVGLSNTASMTNAFHAINNSGGTPGTDYFVTAADPLVIATNPTGTTVRVTAKTAGTAGNAIASTEASTHLSWGAVTLAGGEDADTFDTIGTAAVAKLNAAGIGITHASYDAGTKVLTVADTADNIGDRTIVVNFFSADRVRDVGVPGAIQTIVDGGSAGDALTAAFATDGWIVPIAAAGLRLVA